MPLKYLFFAPGLRIIALVSAILFSAFLTSVVSDLTRIASANLPEPTWSDAFFVPGMNHEVLAVATYQGELVAGGQFNTAGRRLARNIARWDGTQWQSLGGGVDGRVTALLVVGDELIVGGGFKEAGGIPISFVARWNGSSWVPMPGLNGGVRALGLYNGSIVAGTFTQVYRWNGDSWQELGSRLEYTIDALAVYDNQLIAGGRFTRARDNRGRSYDSEIRYVARLEGGDWHPMGGALNGGVHALLPYDGTLLAGGAFTRSGEDTISYVAAWDGVMWNLLGEGLAGGVQASIYRGVYCLGFHGDNLVAGGDFTLSGNRTMRNLVRWDGVSWATIGGGVEGVVKALSLQAEALVVGGRFEQAGDPVTITYNVASWNGASWSALPKGGNGLNGGINALLAHEGNLIAGGRLGLAGEQEASMIAKWDGSGWQPMGSGFESSVYALTLYQDDPIAVGYMGGPFPDKYVMRWDGSSWQVVGTPFNAGILSATVFQGDLVVGGYFATRDDVSFPHRIAKWDGSSWQALGAGVDPDLDMGWGGNVSAQLEYQNKLIVGGGFGSAGDVETSNIASWDGETWSAMGNGLPGEVSALVEFRGELFAGGSFHFPGLPDTTVIAKWNGVEWEPLVPGSREEYSPFVDAFLVYKDYLIAGGTFNRIGGIQANSLAIWNGITWVPLSSGIRERGGYSNSMATAFAVFQDQIYVGGAFTEAGDKVSMHLAALSFEPVSVHLLSFNASRERAVVTIRWEVAENPIDRAGFNVYRQVLGREREQLTDHLLAGQTKYEFIDDTAPREGAEYWLADISRSGEATWHGPAILPPASLPARLVLSPPSPNPFSSETRITYSLPSPQHVSLTIYGLQGRLVATLVDEEQGAGEYTVSWDGRLSSGTAASGLYFLRLRAGKATKTRKLMFVR